MMMFLLKNNIRQLAKFISSYWSFFLGILVLGIIFKDMIPPLLNIIATQKSYLNLAIVLFLLGVFIFRRNATITVNPASIHFLFGTEALAKLINIKFIVATFISAVWALVITFCGYLGFHALYFCHLFLLFTAWLFLMWGKFHKEMRYSVLYFLVLAILAVFILQLHILGIFLNSIIVIFFFLRRKKMLWVEYFADMRYVYQVQSAAARKDYPLMMVIANENSVKKSYLITFGSENLRLPLISKSIIIDTLRTPVSVWIIKIIVLVSAILVYVNSLFAQYSPFASVMLISFSISSLAQENIVFGLNMQEKSRQGLFLPYTNTQIALSYMVVPCSGIVGVLALIGFIYSVTVTSITMVLLPLCLTIYLSLFLSLQYAKQQRLISVICNILIALLFSILIL